MSARNEQLPLFYNNPVALDKKIHTHLSLNSRLTFAFAAKVNAVPVNFIELPFILKHYPIVFAEGMATPLAVLGLRDHENLFVNAAGEWHTETYVPAYIRRYPFIFARNDNGDKLTLCIENNKHVFEKTSKNPFFDHEGKLSDLTNNAIEFCKSYQDAAERTDAFAIALAATDLLQPGQATIQIPEKAPLNFSGFRTVNEDAFYALPAETLADWHAKRWTAAIHAHFLSQTNWQDLVKLMEKRDN